MMKSDLYKKAEESGLFSVIQRPHKDIRYNHHPMSKMILDFLEDLDFTHYGDFFAWSTETPTDNGTMLMLQLDAFFKSLETIKDS